MLIRHYFLGAASIWYVTRGSRAGISKKFWQQIQKNFFIQTAVKKAWRNKWMHPEQAQRPNLILSCNLILTCLDSFGKPHVLILSSPLVLTFNASIIPMNANTSSTTWFINMKKNVFSFSPANRNADILWYSGSWSHFAIRLNVSRPDFNFDHGFGFRSKSESVPCERHKTRCAKIACGML